MAKDHEGVPTRGLSEDFLAALRALAEDEREPNWWRDVLADPRLLVAVRREGLDVHYRGGSLSQVGCEGGRIVANTHVKYLMRQEQVRIPLDADGMFSKDPGPALWERYQGPETLEATIAAAKAYAGEEKAGVHDPVRRAPPVVDVEIALASPAETGEATSAARNRIDVASPNETEGGRLALVFHEAKRFANGDPRAKGGGEPKVLGQMRDYEGAIAARAAILPGEYARVAKALVAIDAMRRPLLEARNEKPAPLDPMIPRAAEGEPIAVDPKPRLVVFGFDEAQRDDEGWQDHLDKLKKRVRVFATGEPNSANAFR